jgi:hypothetical protein
MAAHPPTGPAPSNDGSSIFRRGRQPTPATPSVRPEDLNPDDPAEPLNLDEESVPLDELPPTPPELEEAAAEALFADGPDGVGDSAVALDANFRPATTGAGWLDPPTDQPPSTIKFDDAAALFADLSGSPPDSGTNWEDANATGRVSDSELLRAYEEADRPESGEVLLPPQASIFARRDKATDSDDLLAADADGSGELFVPPALTAGSSIFEQGSLPVKPAAGEHEDDGIGFELPQVDDPAGASQASGRIDLSSPDFSAEEPAEQARSMPDLDLDAEEAAARPVAKSTRKSSKEFIVPSAAAAKPRPTDDEDDDLRPAGRTSSGLGKFIGGAAFGLLAGGVTFAGLYFGGVIPNEKKDPAPAAVRPTGDPDAAAKLAEAKKQLDETLQKAEADKKELGEQLTAAKKDAADAKKQLPDLTAALTKSNNELATAKADAERFKMTITDYSKKLDASLKDLGDAKAAVEKDKQAAIAKIEALGEDIKKERLKVEGELATAKKATADAVAKQKAAEASLAGVVTELKSAKLVDDKFDPANLPATIKQLTTAATAGDAKKAAEALIAVQKEADTLKANLKAAADETARAKAEAADAKSTVEKVKTDADKAVAEAKKGVDDKVKAAVEAATKDTAAELAKAKKDAETVRTTAKAEAEAAARKRIDDAVAKATAAENARAEAAKQYEQKLADQANQYAARLAEARAGGVVQVTSVETAAAERAAKSYAAGLTAFDAGRYADAERLFAAATAAHPADARYWYFLGLTQYLQGRSADAAFRKGAELEARQKPGTKAVSEAFEGLPLRLRAVVKPYRS